MNSVDSNSDWLKDAPNDPEWIDQKAHLVNTANGFKKRRFRCKKRCKKRRSKNPKNPKNSKTEHSAAKKLIFSTNAKMTS
jgi:hypothetical protein